MKRLLEKLDFNADLTRALRVTLAFSLGLAAARLLGESNGPIFLATSAQIVAMPILRGDYGVRVLVLLLMLALISISALAGAFAGLETITAVLFMGVIALLAGCWRQLSSDYGPTLGINSALVYLLSLSSHTYGEQPHRVVEWVILGGLIGCCVQAGSWFVRPQHAWRKAIAEPWVALSDVALCISRGLTEGMSATSECFYQTSRDLRSALDRTDALLQAARETRIPPWRAALEKMHLIGGRWSTRLAALHDAVDSLAANPAAARELTGMESTVTTLASCARSVAVTVISHRVQDLRRTEARFARCEAFLAALQEKLEGEEENAKTATLQGLVEIWRALAKETIAALRAAVDNVPQAWSFPLRLPELGGFSWRRISSGLDLARDLDPVLLRYSLRMALLTMLAVAVYKVFEIPRGYWIAFTITVVLQPDFGATRQKARERVMGTIAGVLIGTALLWIGLPRGILMALAAGSIFSFAFFLLRSYARAVFFATIMLVLLADLQTHVHLDFTLGRLFSSVAGSALAWFAAVLLWPSWEKEKFPVLMAKALRANEEYLQEVAAQASAGEVFSGKAVEAKRRAERAAFLAAGSAQKMALEPEQHRIGAEGGLIAAYNQRLTRAITGIAAHLRKGSPGFNPAAFPLDEINGFFERLDHAMHRGVVAAHELDELSRCARKCELRLAELAQGGSRTGSTAVIVDQTKKVLAELKAMALALKPQDRLMTRAGGQHSAAHSA